MFFFLVLSLPLVLFNFEENYVSEIDNRELTAFPGVMPQNMEDLEEYKEYIDDRYGGREWMIEAYTKLNNQVFGELVHPIYTYGKEGHIFFNMSRGRTFDYYRETFANTVVAMNQYLKERGTDFYVLINPEKTSVYTEYLPDGVAYHRQAIEGVERVLEENGVNYRDTTSLLIEKSQQELVYNRKYDAGHWNDFGAFYGVNHLLSMIRLDYPQIDLLEEADFNIRTQLEESLPVSKFDIEDEVPIFDLEDDLGVEEISQEYQNIELSYQFRHFSYYRNPQAQRLPKALIFQGSYLNSREKFLKTRFSEYIVVHNYENILNLPYYYQLFEPDLVVFEVAEYTVSDTYFSYATMSNLHYPSPIEEIVTEGEITPVKYQLHKGRQIDTFEVQDLPDNAQYAYLNIDGKLYQLAKIKIKEDEPKPNKHKVRRRKLKSEEINEDKWRYVLSLGKEKMKTLDSAKLLIQLDDDSWVEAEVIPK